MKLRKLLMVLVAAAFLVPAISFEAEALKVGDRKVLKGKTNRLKRFQNNKIKELVDILGEGKQVLIVDADEDKDLSGGIQVFEQGYTPDISAPPICIAGTSSRSCEIPCSGSNGILQAQDSDGGGDNCTKTCTCTTECDGTATDGKCNCTSSSTDCS